MTDTPLDLDAIEARANALTPYVDAVENHPMQLRDSRPEVVDLLVAVTLTAQDVPALVGALRKAEAERDTYHAALVAELREQHKGTHICLGAWFTDDPAYRGSIANTAPCPVNALLDRHAPEEGE